MDEARDLALQGAPHGTVVIADTQTAGRGRVPNRTWQAEPAQNLTFTVILRYAGFSAIPSALTLRTGLCLVHAIEEYAGKNDRIALKWPNDVLIGDKKVAGILTIADEAAVLIGIGINVAQTSFPPALEEKATSIAVAAQRYMAPEARFDLLDIVLTQLLAELERTDTHWQEQLNNRLYRRSQPIRFIAGGADAGSVVDGVLEGVSASGEVVIQCDTGEMCRFLTGEIVFSG
jgi:BirA family biotin operon repressor/biotin-[acetyl-CoA-carboxylase] ligase